MRISRLEQLEKNKTISLHGINFYGGERPEAEKDRRKKWVNIVLSIMIHCNRLGVAKRDFLRNTSIQWLVISFDRKLTTESALIKTTTGMHDG